METQVTFTSAAIEKIRDIIAEEGNPNLKLRVFVQGGGCSGFQYGFRLDEDVAEDDFQFEESGIVVLIDAMSMQYLQGSKVHYQEELMSSQFVVDNPNSTGMCGCGTSFSV